MLRAASLIWSLPLVACAGGAPLLAEPRIGTPGTTQVQVGGTAVAPLGDARTLVGRALQPSGDTLSPDAIEAAAVQVALPAGVAPFVRAGVTVDPRLQLSVRAVGRDVGVGGRFLAYESREAQGGALTFSVGLDLSRSFGAGRSATGDVGDAFPGVVLDRARALGVAVPAILGWQSNAGLVFAYVGATLGAAVGGVDVRTAAAPDTLYSATFTRWFATVTGGLGVGFRHVHALAELGVEHDVLASRVSAHPGDGDSRTRGIWSLVPGAAIALSF